ncbi:MAG: sugar ABC transporter ATP-binding protein [Tepidanaerobacteraceae bacterium]|nr:sugar ABC transporter ATP-binding protein [Tepidanaerobacteraceae bacterium]
MPEIEYQVEMNHIYKSFEGVVALHDVSFSVKPGEIHALVGENGAGKSTLIRILSGALQPDQGEIKIRGEKVNITKPDDGIKHGISVIYQEFALFPHISVAENIFIDEVRAYNGFINWKDIKQRAKAFLEELGFGFIDVNARVMDLSVAYQQVIEICKALTRNASVLVLDEPTAVLTTKEVERLFALLQNLKSKDVAIIYVSHRLDEIFRITDRITVLKDGKFVKTLETSSIDAHQLVNLMIGRELSDYFPPRKSNIGEVVLSVEHIRSGRAVKDISFNVREGEVLGLSGLVGAGRTEAMRAIFGVDKLDDGKVTLYGREIKIKSPEHAYRLGIGLLPENRKTQGVLLRMPILHNITLSCLKMFCKLGWINKKQEYQIASNLSKELAVKTASLFNRVASLSGGNQQKVAIAKLLASKCKVLILDEPTRGVDVGAKIEIFKIINSMVEKKCAVIMISSEMTEIIGMCDRAVVIREGRSVGELQKNELTELNLIKYSMGVNDHAIKN